MKEQESRNIWIAAGVIIPILVAFAIMFGMFVWSDLRVNTDAIPAEVPEQPALVITTEDAISYIEQGHTILSLAIDEFEARPSRDMGSVLLQITDEYNVMLGSLCAVEGTAAACTAAAETVVRSYTVLFEYANSVAPRNQHG